MTFVNPVEDTQSLRVAWIVPDHRALCDANPYSYINNLVGHEVRSMFVTKYETFILLFEIRRMNLIELKYKG